MTVEGNGKLRRNSRARRNSVVVAIAQSIPKSEDHSSLNPVHTTKLQRSSSFKHNKSAPIQEQSSKEYLLHPYSQAQRDELFTNYVKSFEYSVIPSEEEQSQLDRNENLKYLKFLESCRFRQRNYSALIDKSSDIIDILKDLTVKYDNVTRETYEFQLQSDSLIEERQKYVNLNEELKKNLHYYELLDTFTRKLNNPSPNIVRKDSFKKMLVQLDECIQFTIEHRAHKDSEQYERRFKQCLTRALTLIRNYVINNLKNIRDNINNKLSATTSNSITQEALLYTRFISDAEFLSEVTGELCQRAEHNEEYEGLLNDCYDFYFDVRYRFIYNNIRDHLKASTLEHKSLVQLIQNNISFFTKIFQDERDLFFKIFTSDNKNSLTKWFQRISESLYDTLRNAILKEQSLSQLCEAATLLDKYYEYEEEDEFENQIRTDETNLKDIDFATILSPILQDIQSRLIFRAQIYIQENIINYKATPKDFRISSRRKSETKQESTDDDIAEDTSLVFSGTSQTGLSGWYPPLSKGVSLLSKIYQLVSSTIFDDLAHTILHECIMSVKRAFQIARQSIGSLDSDLFFLKNLLMLKAHIQTFDIEYVSNETFVDFSGIGEIISKIRNGTNVLNDGRGFLELVRGGAPKVVNNMFDARNELATELRNIVHGFTEDAVNQIIVPIAKLNSETIEQDVKQFQENIETSLPHLKSEICLFIDDQSVITALIDGIQDLVVQAYENYYEGITDTEKLSNVIDVDSLITFVGVIIGQMFDESDMPHIDTLVLDDEE